MESRGHEDFNDEYASTKSWGAKIVFSSTCILTIISIFGPSAAVYVYMLQIANTAIAACQIILCCASVLSLIYLALYVLAARRDEIVGSVRPPSRPWQNPCFVTLRVALIMWLISTIASMVTAFQMACTSSSTLCLVQKIEGGVAIGALILCIVILSSLEKCHKPFTTPEFLHIKPKISCRVSQFRDDLLLERSVSRAASFDSKHRPLELARKQWTDQYSLPSNGMVDLVMPDEPKEMASPILERNANHRVESWGSAWTHLATETGCKSSSAGTSKSSSYVSSNATDAVKHSEQIGINELQSSPSNSSMSDSGVSWVSTAASSVSSNSSSASKKASPSSSISNPFRRSKLSVMRTTDSPDTIVHEQLLFQPVPGTQASDQNRSPRRKPVKKTASPQGLRKYASDNALFPAPLNIRRQDTPQPPSSIPPSPPTLQYKAPRMQLKYPVLIPPTHTSNMSSRRRSIDCRIPGQFEDTPPTTQEESLSRHTRMIEDAIYASAATARTVSYTRQGSVPLIVSQSPRTNIRQSSSLPSMKSQDIPAPLRIGRNLTPPKEHLVVPNEKRTLLRVDSGFDDIDSDEYVYKRIVPERSPRIPTMYLADAKLLWEV